MSLPGILNAVGRPIYCAAGRAVPSEISLSDARRILMVRLDGLGDLVLTGPMIRELRRSAPAARITLVVPSSHLNLVERCPYVDEVLGLGFTRRKSRAATIARQILAAGRLARRLVERRFDLAIVPRWDIDSHRAGLLAYVSGARRRAAYSQDDHQDLSWKIRNQDCLYTHVLHDPAVRHEVERNLQLLRFVGGTVRDTALECWLSPEDEELAEQELRANSVAPGDLLVAFGIGAGSTSRMWPVERFGMLGAWLRKAYGARVLAVGGPGDQKLAQALRQPLGNSMIDVTGRKSLRQTQALLRRCRLHIGNDSGPMHLAAAAGIPVVEISCHPRSGVPAHANAPGRFMPWGVPCRVIQPASAVIPCTTHCISAHNPHCILGVTVEDVRLAVGSLQESLPDLLR